MSAFMVAISPPDWEKIIGKVPPPSAFESNRPSLTDILRTLSHPLRLQLLLVCSKDRPKTTDLMERLRYSPMQHAPHLERLRETRLVQSDKGTFIPGEEKGKLDFVAHFLHALHQTTQKKKKGPKAPLPATANRRKQITAQKEDLLEQAAATFELLHNAVRIRILLTLMQEESIQTLPLSAWQMQHHEKLLREAGLIAYREENPVLCDSKDTRIATQVLEEIVLNMHGIHTQTDLDQAIGNI